MSDRTTSAVLDARITWRRLGQHDFPMLRTWVEQPRVAAVEQRDNS